MRRSCRTPEPELARAISGTRNQSAGAPASVGPVDAIRAVARSIAIDFRNRGPPGLAAAGRPSPGQTLRPAQHCPSRQVAGDQGNDSRTPTEEAFHRRSIDCAIPCRLLHHRARIHESRRSDRAPSNSRSPMLPSAPASENPGGSRQGPASPRNPDAGRLAEGECSPAGASPPRLRTGVTGQPVTSRPQTRWRDSGTSAGR